MFQYLCDGSLIYHFDKSIRGYFYDQAVISCEETDLLAQKKKVRGDLLTLYEGNDLKES